MALKNRLGTDQSIQPLLAQYVPLNLVTAEATAKQAFLQKYRPEGNGIPMVFVIRADGEKLFGETFKQELPTFLTEYLKKAGNPLSDSEVTRLESAVTIAKAAIEKEDVSAAVQALKSAPGRGSYATAATEAAELVKSIKEKADQEIARAGELLGDKASLQEGAFVISKAARQYSKLPEQKRRVGKVLTKYKAREDGASALEQADAFLRTQAREKSKDKRLAITGYQSIVKNYPGTFVADLSSERLAALGEESPAVDATAADLSEARIWISSNGKFEIRAVMVQANATHVQLMTEDGKLIAVPLSKLRAEDVQFVRDNG